VEVEEAAPSLEDVFLAAVDRGGGRRDDRLAAAPLAAPHRRHGRQGDHPRPPGPRTLALRW